MSLAYPLTGRLYPVFVREGRNRVRYKAGYINGLGEVVISPVYDHAYPFRNGLASVRLGERWGAIDPQGNMIIPASSAAPLVFTEDLAAYSPVGQTGIKGIISNLGTIILPPRYRSISHFSEGLACVYTGELYGYIDKSGSQTIPPFFEDARAFSEGVAAVKSNGAWGYIHPDASTAIPIRFVCERGMAGPFREGLARVAKNGKWGHIDRDGKFVTAPRFDIAYEFSGGMAEVILDKRTGYVDHSGELAIPAKFLSGKRFSEGLAAVDTGSGDPDKSITEACETGFIDQQGHIVLSPRFFRTGCFQDGLCLAETEKELLYIDRDGHSVWQGEWVEHGSFDPLHLFPPQA